MGVLDGLQPANKIPPCRVSVILDELEKSDRAILEAALVDKNWSAYGLCRALRQRGIRLDDEPIKRHRSGACSCSKV